MTTSPTIQTNPLDPVFSGVPVTFPQTGMVNPTWNKWFVDLREKVNVINSTLAAWSGITPGSVSAGTYGDTTHYPVVTVNQYGLITAISEQTVSSGGGSPVYVTTISSSFTIPSSAVPASSSYRGMVVANASSPVVATIDSFANTSIPVGSVIDFFQEGTGAFEITSNPLVSLLSPSITPGGQYSSGRAVQIATDIWACSGNLTITSGSSDPYWSYVVSLLHFGGADGSTTITDQIGSNSWSVVGNAKIATTGGRFGNCLSLTGGNSCIQGPSDTTLVTGSLPFCFELFVSTSTTAASCLFSKDNNININWGSFFAGLNNSSKINAFINPNSGTESGRLTVSSTTAVVNDSAQHHIAFTSDASNLYLFVDGILVSTVAGSVTQRNDGTNFLLGASLSSSSPSAFLNANISEFRATIGVARYTSNFTPPTLPFPNS